MQPKQFYFLKSKDNLNNKDDSEFYTLQQTAKPSKRQHRNNKIPYKRSVTPLIYKFKESVAYSISPKPLHDFHDLKILLGALARELKVNQPI